MSTLPYDSVLARDEVLQLSALGFRPNCLDGLQIGAPADLPHLVAARGGEPEHLGHQRVVRVDPPLERLVPGGLGEDRHPVPQAVGVRDEFRLVRPDRLRWPPDGRRPRVVGAAVREHLEAELAARRLADGRKERLEDIVARPRRRGRHRAVDVAVGVAVLDPPHQVGVEDEGRVPAVEHRPVEPRHFDRVDADRVPVQVEVLRVVTGPHQVRSPLAEAEGVVAVHVEVRADDDDELVEQARQPAQENLPGQHQERFLTLHLVRVDVPLEIDHRLPRPGRFLRARHARARQDDRRADLAQRARVDRQDVDLVARPSQRVDELEDIRVRRRPLEARLLGYRQQLGRPLAVPAGRDRIAPVDLLRRARQTGNRDQQQGDHRNSEHGCTSSRQDGRNRRQSLMRTSPPWPRTNLR